MPSSATIPAIEWTAPSEDAEWYQITIRQHGIDVFTEWFQDVDGLCNGGACSLDLNTIMPFGLDENENNGEYIVFIDWWDANAGSVKRVERQDKTMTTAVTSVATTGGRIELTIPDNALFDWVNIWIGDHQDWVQIPDLQNGWYSKADDMTCVDGSCTIFTDTHGGDSNRYVAYLRYYDLETETMGNWSAGFRFDLQTERASAVDGHELVLNANNTVTLSWNGSSDLTWYRIWFGGGATTVDTWEKASDIGCHNGGTCTYTSAQPVSGGAVYSWYVHAWGPSGYPSGGISGSGWSAGDPLFIPGSTSAFQMQNGLLVFEAESTSLAGEWKRRTSFGAYTGNGYVVWREGNTDGGTDQSKTDVLTYIIDIPSAGTYRLLMRATSPSPSDLYNDIFFRILGDGAFAEAVDPSPEGSGTDYVNMGQDWFKVYNNSVEDWKWQASHVDQDAHEVFLVFDSAGEYAVQIAGRSNQFRIDRFVIYDNETITENQATNLANPESPRG